MKGKVEALLFSSGSPLSTEFMKKLLDTDKRTLKRALHELRTDYEKLGGAVYLLNEGEEWKFAVKSAYTEIVSKVVSDIELSFSILETLAVIAYKNPVLQADVVHVRGGNAYEHVSELFEQKFIRKEREGRSYRLYLTEKFFDYFDLEGEKNIREVFKALQEKQKKAIKIIPSVEEETEVQELPQGTNRSGEEILSDVDKKLNALSERLKELDEAKEEVAEFASEDENESDVPEMQEHDDLPSKNNP